VGTAIAVAGLAPTTAASTTTALFAILVVFLVLMRLGLGTKERLTVGHGDLVIVRVDFGKGQESMAISAIFDERCLQGRLHAGDPREIDVSL
jgi:hypothetical protein